MVMARDHLKNRGNWQKLANVSGASTEDMFVVIMKSHSSNMYDVEFKPKELAGIYGEHKTGNPHGIQPEACITNIANGRKIFVETKRQKAKGNAHERACKYFTPGIIHSTRQIAKQPDNVFPFWIIFTDEIATDHRYVQEISHWFKGYEAHFTLCKNMRDYEVIINHFENHIKQFLE